MNHRIKYNNSPKMEIISQNMALENSAFLFSSLLLDQEMHSLEH